MKKTLPPKYYLDHFSEFLSYIRGPSGHLLNPEHQHFLTQYERLPEDAKCLLIRTCHRKHAIFKLAGLHYDEIPQSQIHIQQLLALGLIRRVNESDLRLVFDILTRPELVQLLKQNGLQKGLSKYNKQGLVELAREQLSLAQFEHSPLFHEYGVRDFDEHLKYFLFLYFGDLSGKLNQFSMRDLGVMRTRDRQGKQFARFDSRSQAISAFFYASRLKQCKQGAPTAMMTLEEINALPSAEGHLAQSLRDDYLLAMGKASLSIDPELALTLLSLSDHPKAQEKWLREMYKLGEKEQVRERLEAICEQPESDYILTFAEDFLARKFQKKKTSALTDMLRQSNQTLMIDELYKNSVERGVCEYYRRQGWVAYRSENKFWRALFGLTLWPVLFEKEDCAPANEFDRRPRVLADNQLYAKFSDEIETLFKSLTDTDRFIAHITKVATMAYGQSNGIFRWRSDLLEQLKRLITHVGTERLITVIREMCRDFDTYSDGFPDITVIDQSGLRFEEIKAPGDQLRKNQLLTIRMLREAGIESLVTQVNWCIDPMQSYAVVDIETTGGRANQHRIIEIGAVKVVNGQIVDRWESFVHPGRHIPQSITALTGIDNAVVADAPGFNDIADSLRAFLAGSVFVAHNVNFDYGFIKHEFARLEQTFSMPKLCTVREMRKAKPGIRSYSLANLTQHFGISMTRHHRAMSDAVAAAELLNIINEHRLEQQTLAQASEASDQLEKNSVTPQPEEALSAP